MAYWKKGTSKRLKADALIKKKESKKQGKVSHISYKLRRKILRKRSREKKPMAPVKRTGL